MNKNKTHSNLQPGRTSKVSFEKFVCVFLSLTLVVSGCYLGWSNDIIGKFHDALYGVDSAVSEQKSSNNSNNSSASSSALANDATNGSVASLGASTTAVAAQSGDGGEVLFGESNTRDDVTVDVNLKKYEKHNLSYVWIGLPESGTNFYDAHGSRVFPKVPSTRAVYENDSYAVDAIYESGYRVYTHENNEDDGAVVGAYTFNGWFDYYKGVMPGTDYEIVGYWSFENIDENGISKCAISYAWSGVVPASNVVLKDDTGSVVTVKLPDSKSVVLGDDYTVDSVYKKGYTLNAYNSASRKLGTYTFSGWDKTGTFKTTSNKVAISGSWEYAGEEIDEDTKPDPDSHTVAYAWEGAPDESLNLSKKIALPTSSIVEDGDAYVKDATYTDKTTVDLLDKDKKVLGTFKFSGWTKTETEIGNIIYKGSWSFEPKDKTDAESPPNTTNSVCYVWKNVPYVGMALYDKSGKVVKNPELPESYQLATANSVTLDSTCKAGDELYIHDANGRNSGKYVFSGWKLDGEVAPRTFEMGESSIVFESEWEYVAIREVASGVTGKGAVAVKTDEASKTVSSNTSEGTTPASNTSSNKNACLVEGTAGETVTVKVTPKTGWYVAQVRYATTPTGYVYGSGTSLAYYAILPNGKGEYSFVMPSNHVTIYVDFVSIVWDGTIDVTWYDKNKTSFDIKYAAQFAGLAAIVNGLFTNYPTSKQTVKAQDGVHTVTVDMPDYGLFKKVMGVKDGTSERYGIFTSTYTVADSQNKNNRFSRSSKITTTQRVIGDASAIVAIKNTSKKDEDSQNVQTWSGYWTGSDSFKGRTIYITANLDFGAKQDKSGKWLTTSPLFMPVGGQYCALPGLTKTNAYSKLSSSFCGTLDGLGHEFKNVYAEYYADTNFGDSQSVGLIGRLGCHDSDDAKICPTNPTVRQIVFKSGYISARRSVGGIVGKTGKTTSDYEKGNDGSTGAIIEMCINWASVNSTDKKGCGGIVGAAWNNGLIQYCANFGTITSRKIENPTGGIAGSNEKLIKNCYNVGKIVAFNSEFAEGIATNNGGKSSVKNCYWLRDSATGGGYYGETKADTCYEFGTNRKIYTLTSDLLNGDGDSVWVDGTGVTDYYNGRYYYPVLYFQAKKEEA